MVGMSRVVVSGMSLLSSWSQSIRDKEFLVEMRLQNFDSGAPAQKTDERKQGQARMGRVERVIVEEI